MEQAPKLCFQPEVEEELGGVRKAKANVQRSAGPSQASTPQRALLVLKYLSLGTEISKIFNLCCAFSGLHAAASTFGTKISNFRY
jgi:hypothetical protein